MLKARKSVRAYVLKDEFGVLKSMLLYLCTHKVKVLKLMLKQERMSMQFELKSQTHLIVINVKSLVLAM